MDSFDQQGADGSSLQSDMITFPNMPTVPGNQPVRPPDSQCAVCSSGSALYKCPACRVLTCSVKCVKAHKEATGCTGKRPRSEFAPIGQFSEEMLLRDYRFLEEVARSADASHRGIRDYGTMRVPLNRGRGRGGRGRGRGGHGGKAYGLPHLPRHLHLLMRASNDRSVSLRLMPLGMQRHIDNTSRYDTKHDILWWRVEWLFLLQDGTQLRAASHRVPDDTGVAQAAAAALAYLTAPDHARSKPADDDDSPLPHIALAPPAIPATLPGSDSAPASPWLAAQRAWHNSPLSSATTTAAPTLLPPKQRRVAHARGSSKAAEAAQGGTTPGAAEATAAGKGAATGEQQQPPPPGQASSRDTASQVAAAVPAEPDAAAGAAAAGATPSLDPPADPAAEVAALSPGPPGLFLQHPFAERGQHVYHPIPGTATLRAALWGRPLVEFPCIAVCLSSKQAEALGARPVTDAQPRGHDAHDESDEEAEAPQSKRPRPHSLQEEGGSAGGGMPPPHSRLPAAVPSAGHAGSVRWAHNTFAPPTAALGGQATPAYGNSAAAAGAGAAPPMSTAAFSAAAAAVAQRSQQPHQPQAGQ